MISKNDLTLVDRVHHTLGRRLYVDDADACIAAPVAQEPLRAWLKSWGRLTVGQKTGDRVGESHLNLRSAYLLPKGQLSSDVRRGIARLHLESFVQSSSIDCLNEWILDAQLVLQAMSFDIYRGVYSAERLLDLYLNKPEDHSSEPMGSGSWVGSPDVGTRGAWCATPTPELTHMVARALDCHNIHGVFQSLSNAVILGSSNLHYTKLRSGSQYKRYSKISKALLAWYSISRQCDVASLGLDLEMLADSFVWQEAETILLCNA